MCISQSVGKLGINQQSDVKTIQLLLNFNIGRITPVVPLAEDGTIGHDTIFAIEELQRRYLIGVTPSGTVDPGSDTLKELRKGLPKQLSEALVRAIIPGAGPVVVATYFNALVAGMNANQINTPLRIAHFLAQVGHESLDFRYAEELASGEDYEGREDLGNTHPGDGKKFKGRGLIQLTGRSNYVAYGKHKGRDFVTSPNYSLIATDANLAVDVSCWYWDTHGLNSLADKDDVKAITKVINGGYNGLPDREARLSRAKCFLVIPNS
jgi:putative chitinase